MLGEIWRDDPCISLLAEEFSIKKERHETYTLVFKACFNPSSLSYLKNMLKPLIIFPVGAPIISGY